MEKKKLTQEQKRLDADLWIIGLVTMGIFMGYAMFGQQLISFVKNNDIAVLFRVLVNAAVQFGVAGLGMTIVCVIRKEKFTSFGLTSKNLMKAVLGTLLCFVPYICHKVFIDDFTGYAPFSVMITEDVLKSNLLIAIVGMIIIAIAWGFFEGFNYVVICEKINQRYPSKNQWLDYGAIFCAIFCILFHPFNTSFWGIVEIIADFIAIYGMLIVKKKTGNAWGCVLAFCFIWNAL